MASKSLGTLTCDLILRVGGFVKGASAAERQADRTTKEIARKHRAMARQLDEIYKGIGLAAAAAFAAIGVSVKRSVDDMQQLVVLSRQVAMPVDQFSELAAVAKDADVNVDSLTTGLRTMAKNLALAQQGSAQARAAFAALGLDPAKLKDSKTAFLAISDALSKYRDGVNKTALEQQIFGRSGAELNALVNQGSVAIRGLMDEQREMGNSVTPAAAKALQDYDDAADHLNDQITGLRNKIALAFLPAMTEATEKIGQFLGSLDSKTVEDFAATITGLGDAFGYVVKQTADGFKAVQAFGRWMAFRKSGVIDTDAPLRDQESQFNQLLTKRETLQNRFNSTGNAFVKSQLDEVNAQLKQAQEYFKAIEQLKHPGGAASGLPENKVLTGKDVPDWMKAGLGGKPALPELNLPTTAGAKGAALPDLAATTAKMQAGFIEKLQRDITVGLKDYTDAQHAAVEAVAQYGTGAQSAAAKQTLLNEQVRILSQDMLPQLEAMGLSAGQAMDVINKRAADLVGTGKQTFDAFAEFGKQAAANIQDSLAQFLFDPFEDGLKGMLTSLSETLRKMAAQMAAQAALKALFGAMSGSSTGWVSAIGKAFGGGKAVGGPVSAGTTYLIGEKGPELFTPSASGTITANNRIATGGGIVVNSNVNVNADNASDDPAAAKQLAKMIEAQTKATVLRAIQPGGILWKQQNRVAA